ncbi:hypothetical protein Glove_50g97 [Diversispora epigaea]|uniref:Uncharacterized protein n=1 Tax=Diversispora epigaea TaxID=1348612 RepID=A0A397JIB2_9GLOM|nr:hypothetical protein Glove_50g97 [Diversispora epigaea]
MKFLFTTLFTVLTFIASVRSTFSNKNAFASSEGTNPPTSPYSPPQDPILYNNFETIMSCPIPVIVIFYGDKWHRCDQEIITDFINGVSETPYWGIAREYYQNISGNVKHVTGSVKHVKSINHNTTVHGTNINPYSASDLVYNLITTDKIPVDNHAEDVSITWFNKTNLCTDFCGIHDFANVRDTILKFAFVGDPGRCPGKCVFPNIHKSLHVPDTPNEDVSITWFNKTNLCTDFCGIHDFANVRDTILKFAFVGDPGRCPGKCVFPNIHKSLHVPDTPNGKILDSMVSMISHELFETVTNPILATWYDKNGKECAEKCEPFYQPLKKIHGKRDVVYNLCVGKNKYFVQQIWNPRTQRCELSAGKKSPFP